MQIQKLAKKLAQYEDRDVIITIKSLLLLMKKFWKSLSSSSVIANISQNYPDVLSLYKMLWWSKCSINQCQQLLLYVSNYMDHNHLQVITLDNLTITQQDSDSADYSPSSSFWLSVIGKGKVYKRTLEWDLSKLAN